MAEHTPGPWKVDATKDLAQRVVASGNLSVAAPTWAGHEHGTIMANARLMAAAPDLLACLRSSTAELIAERDTMYESFTRADGTFPDRQDEEAVAQLDAIIDANRAAIAKAEGRES